MRCPSSTKSVVRNGKKPREKNGVKKTLGAKSALVSPGFRVVIFFLADYLRSRKTGKRGTTRSLYVAALAQGHSLFVLITYQLIFSIIQYDFSCQQEQLFVIREIWKRQ